MNKTEKHKIIGQRLGECIREKGITQATIIKEMELRGMSLLKQNLSSTIRSGRQISEKYLLAIAEILNVHSGYLIGDDDFICKTYSEYMDFKNLFSDPNFTKYHNAIKYAGFAMSANLAGEEIEYYVTRLAEKPPTSKEFSATSMELFYKRIIKAINDLFDDYMDKEPVRTGDLSEYFDRLNTFLKWHPDFDPNQLDIDIRNTIITAPKRGTSVNKKKTKTKKGGDTDGD